MVNLATSKSIRKPHKRAYSKKKLFGNHIRFAIWTLKLKEQKDDKKTQLMFSSWFTSVKIVIEKVINARSGSGNSWESYGEVHEIAGWYEIQFVLLPGLAATVAILSFQEKYSYRRNIMPERAIYIARL